MAFEAIHRAIAQTWSESMAPAICKVTLHWNSKGSTSPLSHPSTVDESPCAQIMLFSIASTPINGFMMMTGALHAMLGQRPPRDGLRIGKPAAQTNSNSTRIEAAIARETTRSMLAAPRRGHTWQRASAPSPTFANATISPTASCSNRRSLSLCSSFESSGAGDGAVVTNRAERQHRCRARRTSTSGDRGSNGRAAIV